MQQPPNTLPGIDVSHWQNAINWTKVAASGRRFVIMKATEGRTFDDPNYASYRAGATGAGLIVTAYHFARPDSTANDAALEADHFVDVAQLDSGNVIPVLDLEKTGGLGAAGLTAWAFTWLEEVAARLGVKPMIYSGPNFWRTNMADTSAFADAGYRMWVANWGVSAPDVPGGNWGGKGWTFWQWTDCVNVPGIAGCVDADWYSGTDLGQVTIRRLTVSVNAAGGRVTSLPAGIRCGVTCSSLFDPGATVTLTATPDAGAVLVGWSGDCVGTASCVVTMDADRSVTATFGFTLTTTLTGAGQGTVTSSPAGITCGTGGQACQTAFPTGTGVTLTPAAGSGSEFAGWSGDCVGTGSCVVAMDTARAVTATFVDDTPPMPSITTPGGIAGAATVSFDEIVHRVSDGNVVLRAGGSTANEAATLACTSPKGAPADCSSGNVVRVRLQPVAPLVPGQRYTVIVDPPEAPFPVVDRGGNPAPTTSQEFTAATTVEQASPALQYRWRTISSPSAYGRSYEVDHLARAKASFEFAGGSVTWYTVTGPSQGMASVSIDGRFRGTFNQYAPAFHFKVPRSFTRLGPGPHTISIIVKGAEGSSAGTDAQVAVDAFAVGGTLYATPVVAASWHPLRAAGASGGSVAQSDLAGSSVSLRFRGTVVDWYTALGPNQGRARIYVDGRLARTFDNYSPTVTYDVARRLGGLDDGVHTLRIVVLGTARPAATDAMVAVDRFVVG